MRPLILITNDDGILSPGLKAAAEAVLDIGDLIVAAPRFQQTSMGRSFPKGDDIGKIEEFHINLLNRKYKCFGIHGSPAQAVSHAILEVTTRKPDLCISGINYGENLGTGLFPSGTVGAALEAYTYGIPGIAVNVEASIQMQHSNEYNPMDWEIAQYFTNKFAKYILNNGLPYEVALMNINVPSTASRETKIKITKQSKQDYFIFRKPEKRNFGSAYKLKTKVEIDYKTLEIDSDIQAFVVDRLVSATPLTWDLSANVNISANSII